MSAHTKNEVEKLLPGQKVVADTVSVPLSKEEIEFLIHQVCCITDNQALKRGFELYQKLTGVLEALENNDESGQST